MNKNFKKIAASIAAAALCAVSAMSTTLNVNAAESNKHSTFRTYFYYDAANDTSNALDSLEICFYTYHYCPVKGPGIVGPVRTYGCLNNFSWAKPYGSGSQYGELGIMTTRRTNKTKQSGMICQIVTEAKDNKEHDLAWAIGNEYNENSGSSIEYSYRIRNANNQLMSVSEYSQYESKAYEDADKDVLKSDLCVKAMTVRIGDINLDGVVNSADRQWIYRYVYQGIALPTVHKSLGGKMQSYYAADINGDGQVNGTDYSLITNYLNGYQRLVDCQFT